MEIVENIEQKIKDSLSEAKEVWVAVAMMDNEGLELFESLDENIIQHHIVGIDLPTPPETLRRLHDLCSNTFSAKVARTKSFFYPKMYMVKNQMDEYYAFVGSSNATNGGLRNSIALNVFITLQSKCIEILKWYEQLDIDAHVITKELIIAQIERFEKTEKPQKEIDKAVDKVKELTNRGERQFFSPNHYAVFSLKYQNVSSSELKKLRKEVWNRLMALHRQIHPQFSRCGMADLHEHPSNRTSKYYINKFSELKKSAIWLHYGKSRTQLAIYQDKDEGAFVNHLRMQVIICNDYLGVWLVLGKEYGSEIDRKFFRQRMKNQKVRSKFLNYLGKLHDSYTISGVDTFNVRDIKSIEDIDRVMESEKSYEYFIIGRKYEPFDKALLENDIATTILNEFAKLYPIYELMNAEIDLPKKL